MAVDPVDRAAAPALPAAAIELRVLGDPELWVDGRHRTFPPGRPGRLLAALALAGGHVVGSDRLVDLVWGEHLPADARAALHTTVGRARRALGDRADLLERSPAGYRLTGCRIDGDDYLASVRELAGAPAEETVRRADELERAWRGPAWGGLGDLAESDRLPLEDARLRVEELRAAALVELGRAPEAVADLQRLLARHPLREEAVALLITTQHRTGDVVGALAAYAAHRDHLVDELGLDPSPRLVALQGEVLRREEATAPGTAADPATDPSPDAAPDPVAAASAPLIGRVAQIGVLDRLVGQHRCVSVVGPGGVGKTSLVRAWVAGRAHAWVDLTSARSSQEVVRVVADAVGAEVYPGSDTTAVVAAHLRTRPTLLVLDNCEHVLPEAAALVGAVLAVPAETRVLATSRERLGVAAESVLPLPPLRLPAPGRTDSPAVELFLARAASVAPDLVDDAATRAIVAELVRRLDGLPLAIELAAHRVGAFTLEDLNDRLRDRLELLRSRSPRYPDRQRTVGATVRWSYDLLDEPGRVAFRRLSVFAGGFDLDGATAVLGTAAPDLVADLVDRSLVVGPGAHGPARYRMLETVRSCAAELLTGEERLRAHQAHAFWVAAAVEAAAAGMRGAEERECGRALDRLLPDATAAMDRMLLVGEPGTAGRIVSALRWWSYLHLRSDVVARARVVLAQDAAAPAGVHLAAATHHWLEGDPAGATRAARQAIEVAEPGSPIHIEALDVVSDAALTVGDFEAAEQASTEAHHLAAEAGHRTEIALALVARALAAIYAGRPDPTLLAATQEAAARAGNPTVLAFASYTAGEFLAQDDPDAALEALEAATHLARELGDRLVVGVCRTAGLAIRARTAPVDQALREHCAAALDYWLDAGNEGLLTTCLRNLVPLLGRMEADAELIELVGTTDPELLDGPDRAPAEVGAALARLGPAAVREAWSVGSARTTAAAGRALVDLLRQPEGRLPAR